MAIERTDFNNNLTELKTWLEANATDYFDSFTITESNNLVFTKNGVDMIKYIPQSGNTTFIFLTLNLQNGTSKTITTGTGSLTYLRYVVKTNNGILFSFAGKNFYMVVSKTSNNHTGIIFSYSSVNTSTNTQFECFDETSLSIDICSLTRITKQLTSLCPVVSGGQSQEYFPNVFYPLFRQNNNEGSFTLNGENYYAGYYGDVVLKD